VSSVRQSAQTEVLSHQTDDEVCGFALEQDHSSRYIAPRWEDYIHFRKYVDEAKQRGFSALSCASLFGWESALTKQAPADTRNVADRLKQLKSLYERGLITKSSYDEKRLQVLEDL